MHHPPPARVAGRRGRMLVATLCVLASADLALTASGTATIQTALHDVPMVIVYRTSPLTYQLARRPLPAKLP
jgi:lipid-A-disaccharide synthase